jgi:hypothetical protein
MMAGVATAGLLVAMMPTTAFASGPTGIAPVQPSPPAPHAPHPRLFAAPAAVPATAVTSGLRFDTVQLTTSSL